MITIWLKENLEWLIPAVFLPFLGAIFWAGKVIKVVNDTKKTAEENAIHIKELQIHQASRDEKIEGMQQMVGEMNSKLDRIIDSLINK